MGSHQIILHHRVLSKRANANMHIIGKSNGYIKIKNKQLILIIICDLNQYKDIFQYIQYKN